MRIASHCQDHALVLLQVAQECPEFKEQAEFLAHEWLAVAALRIELAKTRQGGQFCTDSLGRSATDLVPRPGEKIMASPKNSKHKEYAHYAVHCLKMVPVAPS